MSFYFTEIEATRNLDGSVTHKVGANFTTPMFGPQAQMGTALPNTTLPSSPPALPFPGSAWNTAIPGSPTLDPNSAAIVSNLVQQWNDGLVGLNEIAMAAHLNGFGAYYLTGSSQPTLPVDMLSLPDDYSDQVFGQVPVPPQAIGTASLCSAIGVWQPTTHQIWELISPAYNNGWFALDGHIFLDTGTGISVPLLAGLGYCGISLWALSIKVEELQNGAINHALGLSLPYLAPGHVNPAAGDYGASTDPRSIQTGIKFQLTPGTNISAMSALGQIVATALENYGAYVIGTNPTGLSLLCEDPGQYSIDPYAALFGTTADNHVLDNLPVPSFRVILHP